jgi:hypothetical protein
MTGSTLVGFDGVTVLTDLYISSCNELMNYSESSLGSGHIKRLSLLQLDNLALLTDLSKFRSYTSITRIIMSTLPSLTSINDLANVTTCQHFLMELCIRIKSIDLPLVTRMSATIIIQQMSSLSYIGFNNLTRVLGIQLSFLPSLTHFDGFQSLTYIGTTGLSLTDMQSLTLFTAFPKLQTISFGRLVLGVLALDSNIRSTLTNAAC